MQLFSNFCKKHMIFLFITVFLCQPVVNGSNLEKTRGEIENQGNLGTIRGEITTTASQEGQIVVQQYVKNEEGVFVLKSKRITSSQGDYQFNVEPGAYYIAAFVDVNRDGEGSAGEPFNYHRYRGEPSEIIIKLGETVTVNLTITDTPPPLPADLRTEKDLVP